MNEKSATTARAGRASGRTTRKRMPISPQPSMRAASESSRGMVMKNCRRRKMLNADPNQAGTQSGLNVPSQAIPVTSPSHRKMLNSGTMVTGKGIIIVASMMPNSAPRPRNGILAKPYATTALESVVPATVSRATIIELRVQSRKLVFSPLITSQ